MSAIPCSSVSLKTMMDGTLRISFDFEPAHAQEAFKLFAAPGTPAAIAALKAGYALKSDEPEPEAPKGGALAKLAGMWCQSKDFQEWLGVPTPAEARLFILEECEIDSRAELDNNQFAAERFHRGVREPYSRWLKAIGKAL